jgi:hypothetical protein
MNSRNRTFQLGVGISLCLLAVAGCSSNKAIVRFTPKAPELYSKKSLAQILKNAPSPKIVLRVPVSNTNSADGRQTAESPLRIVTAGSQGESEAIIYNAIEKQLFRSGFTVRDRALFNEVLRKSGNIDYTTVNGLTDTDLILELVRLDTQVPYVTNKYYQQNKKKEVERTLNDPNSKLTLYGGLVEFKVIHVRTNELLGTYLFNYTPCLEGCPYELQSDGKLVKVGSTEKAIAYEQGKPDYLERFLTRATQQLVQAMKQTPAAVSRTK